MMSPIRSVDVTAPPAAADPNAGPRAFVVAPTRAVAFGRNFTGHSQ
jgi:hypothetical protein